MSIKPNNNRNYSLEHRLFIFSVISLLFFSLLILPSKCYFGLNELITPGPLRDRYLNDPCEWDGNEPMAMEGFQEGFVKFLIHEISDALRDGVEQLREFLSFAGHYEKLIGCIVEAAARAGHAKRRKKRDRLDDRFTDTRYQELRVVKCIKQSYVIQDLPKIVYNFVPVNWVASAIMLISVVLAPAAGPTALIFLPPAKWWYYAGKCMIRMIGDFIKGALTLANYMLPWIRGLDIELFYFFGREIGQLVTGICATVSELIMDVANLFNEETFAEGTDWLRCLTDHDNKISLTELVIYAECTYSKAAGSHDLVRIDGSARIDDYYEDLSVKIQSVERNWELNTYQRRTLLKVKEQFCIATWSPTDNEMPRVQVKLFYTWAMMRTDKVLDPSELACITLILANFEYLIDRAVDYRPSGLISNYIFEEQWQNVSARVCDHVEDIVSATLKLDLSETARDEDNKALHNLTKLVRMLLILLEKVEYCKVKIPSMVEKLVKSIDIIAGEKCPGDKTERVRLLTEFAVINRKLGGKDAIPKKVDCENQMEINFLRKRKKLER